MGSPGGQSAAVAGMRLGNRYELKSAIAAGGMAQVWSGTDLTLDRPVAVKILHPHLSNDTAFVKRFQREAMTSAGLSHRSIVSVYDTVSDHGMEAIVMELIDGRTLREVLNEVRVMSVADAIDLGIQIASALDAAHRSGIVHRDIKPANIMIGSDGRAMVTDFGIAKAGSDADLTATGTLLGTAKYLAPEQLSGGDVDPRSDIFALGVVLYEALAGTIPFKATTDAAMAIARLHQTPQPLRSIRGDIPPSVESIVATAMARDPDKRYPRAEALKEALEAVQSGGDPARKMPPAPPPQGPRIPAAPTPGPPMRGTVGAGAGPLGGGMLDSAPPGVSGGNWDSGFQQQTSAPIQPERVKKSKRPLVALLVLVVTGLGAASIMTSFSPFGALGGEANPLELEGPGLAITGATSFDPLTSDSEKEENEPLIPRSFDGDNETSWTTESYRSQSLGSKEGVGVLFEIGEPLPLNLVEITTRSEGWQIEAYVGSEFGNDPATWGEPAGTGTGVGGTSTIELDRTEGTQLLLWIVNTGETGGKFRFELSEVTIR